MRLAWTLVLLALGAGCASPSEQNLLQDPGFEAGGEGWFWLEGNPGWAPFNVTRRMAWSGDAAAETQLQERDGVTALISGAIQEFTAGEAPRIPSRFAGRYHVERWTTTVERTYLAVAVTVTPRPDATQPLCPGLRPRDTCQLGYSLGGLDGPPAVAANKRFTVVAPGEPAVGEWVAFDLPLRDDFERLWGQAPQGYASFRVYIEARYDLQDADPRPVDVDAAVLWDALSLEP